MFNLVLMCHQTALSQQFRAERQVRQSEKRFRSKKKSEPRKIKLAAELVFPARDSAADKDSQSVKVREV